MVAYNVQREHLLPSEKAKLSFNKARRMKELHEKGNLDEGTVLVIITDEGPPPQEMITFALSEAQNWLLHDRRPEQIRTEILNMLIRNVKKEPLAG